jgi:hypothetical protein
VTGEAIARDFAESLGFILVMLSFIAVARPRILRIGRTAAAALGLAACVVFLVAYLLPPDWPFEAAWLAITAFRVFIFWWRRRKGRRRARVLWGQKGLARLRSMLAAQRERARPRPVLKPHRSPA